MLAATIAVLSWAAVAQNLFSEPFPAHRIIGNVYYVGSKDLASYLITTPEGHILINSGFEETVPLIRKSVESLGFKMADVKILLNSHAHSDHVAGLAALRDLTGAKVLMLGPVPDPHTSVPTCLSGHLDDATACSPRRSSAHPG